METMKLAVLGLGEVGRCFAAHLTERGFELQLQAPRPNAAALALATQKGLALHRGPGAWLGAVDWVLSCVTGTQALGVAQSTFPHLQPGATYCDFTTATRQVKQEAADQAAALGIRYVDVAIMGAVSLGGFATPMLASGTGAEALAGWMDGAGARLQVMAGAAAGDAVALKMLRSVFTKGLEALSVEVTMAAQQQGLLVPLLEQLRDVDETPLRTFMAMLVSTHVVHAGRRLREVQDARQALLQQGLPSAVLPGVEGRFAYTAERLAVDPLPQVQPTMEQALQWLLAHPMPT